MHVEKILEKLVSFPVLGGQSNLEILEWIKSYLNGFGVTSTLVPNPEGTKASLHCRIGPAVDGGTILSGHMDVVPVAGQDWHTDPFVLTDKGDGKLYGRGSCDMKGFLACCLAVLPKMTEAQLTKPIYFAFSYDEEIGCLAAPELAEHIKTHYTEKPKFALIGEPSLMQPIVGQKGIYIMKVNVEGSAGHSSRIRQEVSAVHEAARLILWLEDRMNQLVAAKHIDERFNPPHTSFHIGMVQGGVAPNVIADKAHFFVDIRTIPQDKLEELKAEFEAHCKAEEMRLQKIFAGTRIILSEDHPPVPPLDTPDDAEIVDLIKSISNRQDLGTVAYAAEAGQFSEAGFQSVICGPGSIAQAHRANEFIAKDELAKGVAMLEKLIEQSCES